MTRFTLIDHYWWCDQRLSTYDPWSVGPAELTSSTEPPSGMHCWLVRLRERLRFIYDLLFCLWGMVPRKIFENKKGSTAWKASKYWAISGPYFPAFGLNTEIYGVRIQCSEDVFSPNTGKYGPEITPHLDTSRIEVFLDEKFHRRSICHLCLRNLYFTHLLYNYDKYVIYLRNFETWFILYVNV